MGAISELEEEIKKIKIELVMEGYHSGWAIAEYKKRLAILEDRLDKLKNKDNDNSSFFHKKK